MSAVPVGVFIHSIACEIPTMYTFGMARISSKNLKIWFQVEIVLYMINNNVHVTNVSLLDISSLPLSKFWSISRSNEPSGMGEHPKRCSIPVVLVFKVSHEKVICSCLGHRTVQMAIYSILVIR